MHNRIGTKAEKTVIGMPADGRWPAIGEDLKACGLR
ncbi:protein of unknown function (plasmid) [Cupriavidus taiwanensis]|uniref:Uncharacterized protein n=1 Tax=Cupriavidus taiwanensis TaxID=164546 RepID=A0A375IRY7_9BURK|nr:protein of unknown function [Cupriavidus taiwanensis]